MKRIIVLGAVAAMGFITTTAFAQYNDVVLNEFKNTNNTNTAKDTRKEERLMKKSEVSYSTKESFFRDFPNADNVAYRRGASTDEVMFTQAGVSYTAFYDADGNLVGTTTAKNFDDLPAAAQKTIAKHYGTYDVGKIILFDDNEFNETDPAIFGEQFEDEDNYFVELIKPGKTIIVEVNMEGNVSYFKGL
ncbi:MAG: hypothetical protein QM731_26970 [Chitinophagaceae bacterium]